MGNASVWRAPQISNSTQAQVIFCS